MKKLGNYSHYYHHSTKSIMQHEVKGVLCADYRITSNTAKSEIEMDCNPIDSDNEITIDMIRII
jgi:hypothetical protein